MSSTLSLQDQAWLTMLMSQRQQHSKDVCASEYSFANTWLFSLKHQYQVIRSPIPGLLGKTYNDHLHFMPLIDPLHIHIEEWEALFRTYPLHCIYPLSDAESQFLMSTGIFAYRDYCDDDSDYVYAADNFRFYRGKRLRKKHNLMQQLLTQCIIISQPLTEQDYSEAQDILKQWSDDKNKTQDDADQAECLLALTHLQQLGLQGRIYRQAKTQQALGFIISEELANHTCVIHFAKGLNSYKGLYQYMFHEYIAHADKHYLWVNFEQDLGIANFRHTKRSYDPTLMVHKYRVYLKPPPAI